MKFTHFRCTKEFNSTTKKTTNYLPTTHDKANTQKPYGKWKKPDAKKHMWSDFIYMEFLENIISLFWNIWYGKIQLNLKFILFLSQNLFFVHLSIIENDMQWGL